MNITHYGNTSAASLPILLDEWISNGSITLTCTQKNYAHRFRWGVNMGCNNIDNIIYIFGGKQYVNNI